VGGLFDRLGTTVHDAFLGPDGMVPRIQGALDSAAATRSRCSTRKATAFFTTLFDDLGGEAARLAVRGSRVRRRVAGRPGAGGGDAVGTWVSDRTTQFGDFFDGLGRPCAGLLDAPDGLVPRFADALGQVAQVVRGWIGRPARRRRRVLRSPRQRRLRGCWPTRTGWFRGSARRSRRSATASAGRWATCWAW
jgi:hypothetical protein